MNSPCTIPLYKRKQIVAYALVDCEDMPLLNTHRWGLLTNKYKDKEWQYAVATTSSRILMHRLVMRLKKGDKLHVDHKNQIGLDNQKSNLRKVTRAQNMQNRTHIVARPKYPEIQMRGVTFEYSKCDTPEKAARKRCYRARVVLDKRIYRLGYHYTVAEAAQVAATFRQEHMAYTTN